MGIGDGSKAEKALVAMAKLAPGVGFVIEAANAFIPDNTENMRAALVDELHSDLNKLEQRVSILEQQLRGQGKKAEAFDATQRTHLARTFLKARTEAYSEEQRDGLLNASVAQYDPRRGTKAERKYWLDLVASLSAEEYCALRALSENEALLPRWERGEVVAYNGNAHSSLSPDLGLPTLRGLELLRGRHVLPGTPPAVRLSGSSGTRVDGAYNASGAVGVLLSYIRSTS